MKRVEWWLAKVYSRKEMKRVNQLKENPIDLWQQFPTEHAVKAYIKKDGPDSPFLPVKVTYETVVAGSSRR